MRVVLWGTYDIGKPRTRILSDGLRRSGIELIECHADVWSRVEDKSHVTSWWHRGLLMLRWLTSYPGLVWRYLRLPAHDAVVVGYPGQLDVLVIWPFARIRRAALILDLVQSLYATVVDIRGMVGPRHPLARSLFALEWLAFRAADRVVFLSRYGALQFGERFGLRSEKTASVMIGVEAGLFPARAASTAPRQGPFTVLFYGSFHRLHGVDTIVEAAYLANDLDIDWVLIGSGQEERLIRERLAARPASRLRWIPWVEYRDLVNWLHRSDVALGLMGRENQTGWVIPNKVFQILAAGVPLISADTPAIRELTGDMRPGIELVPAGNATALLEAVNAMRSQRRELAVPGLHAGLQKRFDPETLGRQFVDVIRGAVGQHGQGGGTPC